MNTPLRHTNTQLFQTVFVLGFCLVFASAVAAWTGPSTSAPGGDVATPINAGSASQVKNGGLGVNALSVFGDTYFQNGLGVGVVPSTTGNVDLSGGLTVTNTGAPSLGRVLVSKDNQGTLEWATLAIAPDDVQEVKTYNLSTTKNNSANTAAVIADMQANGGVTIDGNGSTHNDATTISRLCEIITGDANASYVINSKGSYYSPNGNYIYIWNGTQWVRYGASSYNSYATDITCTKPGGLQATFDSGQTVSY